MRYCANHYVSVDGDLKTPGEFFDAELSPEQEARLLRLGAIRKDAPAPAARAAAPAPAKKPEPEPVPEEEPEKAPEETDMEPVEEKLSIDPTADVVAPKAAKKRRGKEG